MGKMNIISHTNSVNAVLRVNFLIKISPPLPIIKFVNAYYNNRIE